jgi:quinol monooxygenase YgiN
MIERRAFVAATAALAATAGASRAAQAAGAMYGLMGRMLVTPGKRDEVITILLAATGAMPGCLSYVVAEDAADPNAVWTSEVWDSEASHTASLRLAAVQAAIAKARPMIAGFGERFVTRPRGGVGIPTA